ncbi:hypothetical protein N7467_010317, partial [Penicillium canescens]
THVILTFTSSVISVCNLSPTKLKEVAGDTKRSLKHPSTSRSSTNPSCPDEERLERGEVDSNMIVTTPDRRPQPQGRRRRVQRRTLSNNRGARAQRTRARDAHLLSRTEVTATLTTPSIPPRPPGSFSMRASGWGPRQDRPTPRHPNTQTPSPQPMLTRNSGDDQPHDVSVFSYSNHNIATSRLTATLVTTTLGLLHPFRQNMYGTVDYNAAPSASAYPSTNELPPYMAPHHMHDMSQSRIIDQRSLPFHAD